MSDDFSHERLLRLFTSAPRAAWRHDVDVSLSAAVKMARFAQVAGVRSTFYLMPRSYFYNLLSSEGGEACEAILDAGHALGIHVDHRGGDPVGCVEYERRLVEAAYPAIFSSAISFHMPRPSVLWRDFGGFESAYASKWEGRYLSDSRREFGPDKEARVADEMQVNLHPEHWFA